MLCHWLISSMAYGWHKSPIYNAKMHKKRTVLQKERTRHGMAFTPFFFSRHPKRIIKKKASWVVVCALDGNGSRSRCVHSPLLGCDHDADQHSGRAFLVFFSRPQDLFHSVANLRMVWCHGYFWCCNRETVATLTDLVVDILNRLRGKSMHILWIYYWAYNN